MIVPSKFVCSSFLISVFMFMVSKALLISSTTFIVRAGGSIWSNPLLRCCLVCVVPSLQSVVLCTVLHGCVWYVCCYVRKKALLQCICNY